MAIMSTMPPDLETTVSNMTPFQRKYCEYRANGHKQGTAAIKAGSESEGSAANRVGYQTENMAGSKEYILWLQQEKAKIACIDEVEIIQKLRAIYEKAMDIDKLSEANKAVELMGTTIGIFGSSVKGLNKKEALEGQRDIANAFKEDAEGSKTDERILKLQAMLKDINKT
jgi:hypothetical protein